MEAAKDSTAPRYTAEVHTASSPLKPARLLELKSSEQGAEALIEFDGGFGRWMHVDRVSAWHPLFDSLQATDRNRLRRHCEEKQALPDGNLRVLTGPLSFVSERRTPRGRYIEKSRFDVPAEDYHDGAITGIRAAGEMLALLKARPEDLVVRSWLNKSLEEAGVLSHGQFPDLDEHSKRSAAVSYLRVMTEFLVYAAKYSDSEEYIAARAEREAASRDWWRLSKAEERAQFVADMAAARARKRAARESQIAA